MAYIAAPGVMRTLVVGDGSKRGHHAGVGVGSCSCAFPPSMPKVTDPPPGSVAVQGVKAMPEPCWASYAMGAYAHDAAGHDTPFMSFTPLSHQVTAT